MPRITRPTAEQAQAFKREFALFHALDPQGTGQIEESALEPYKALAADASAALAGGDAVAFEDFAKAFQQKTQDVTAGSGECLTYAAHDDTGIMTPMKVARRVLRPNDVEIRVTYCGMCHSDVHQIRNEWGNSIFPMVPGHEVIGVVLAVGAEVQKVKVGQFAAIGCMVDSCLDCRNCKKNEEQYCLNGFVATYNSMDKHGEPTYGGYSTTIVSREEFVLKLHPSLHCPGGAPLLCAGITVYSPMKYYGADKAGQKIAVVGCGGLGHMAVKFARAFGQHVTVVSRSYKKKELALKELGADDFVATGDDEAVKNCSERFDAIIDTVSAEHDMDQLLGMLAVDGHLVCVGVPGKCVTTPASFIFRRRTIGGSLIGGIKETQEMLDFCAEKGILSTVEVVDIDYVNKAIDRIVDGDVHFRFVIDMLSSWATK